MTLRLHDGPADSSPALLDRVHHRIDQALRHVAQRIGDVHVWFSDLNAGKGGVDKRCRIVAHVARHGPIVVESRDADYYRAVDAAAAKLSRAAEHRFTRR